MEYSDRYNDRVSFQPYQQYDPRSNCYQCYCCPVCWPTPDPPPVSASLQTVKRDGTTNLPVSGAAYTLYQNGRTISTSVSSSSGTISFAGLTPGEYELVETITPNGYQPDVQSHRVVIDADGNVTIDGQSVAEFSLYDTRIGASELPFSFQKTDALTGNALAGAVFTLSNGQSAISDSNGVVDFGSLEPGTYTMTETSAPDGYEADSSTYTVEVASDGSIAVNGISLESFSVTNTRTAQLSPRPIINSVVEGDLIITGEGVPGAQLVVTLPDGSQVSTVVDASGHWIAQIPNGITLRAGQTIHAYQTVDGFAPSDNASFEIQAGA